LVTLASPARAACTTPAEAAVIGPYRLLAAPERSALAAAAARHGDHPSIDLVFNAEMQYFWSPQAEGFVPFRERGRLLCVFAGPVAAASERGRLLGAFLEHAREQRREVLAVQVREPCAEIFAQAGFRLNQLGRSYTLALGEFELRGHRFMKLRNKLKQPTKSGVEVGELGLEIPRDSSAQSKLAAITDGWLRSKGRHTKLLEFLVGEVSSIEREGTRCFLAQRGSEPLAFITYVPAHGQYRGYMHDLTRRLPEAPAGTMELVNLSAIQRFQSEAVPFLNFGLTPFVGVRDEHPSHSPGLARVIRVLADYGKWIYPAESQVAYKMKWAPQIDEPEFIAFRGRLRPSFVWQLLRLTRAI
jgi:lysylphosphatidylglycerol synthetase-like protein (DUF2156 family)